MNTGSSAHHHAHRHQAAKVVVGWFKSGLKPPPTLPDKEQTHWQAICIQFAGTASLPVIGVGMLLGQEIGVLNAIVGIILGNLLLMIMGVILTASSFEGRMSTMQVGRAYVTNLGGLLIPVALLVVPIGWFPLQVERAASVIIEYMPGNPVANFPLYMQVAGLLGLAGACCAVFGIKGIRYITVFSTPFLLAFFVYELIRVGWYRPELYFSFAGALLAAPKIVAISQARIVDFPTFFRHCKTKKDAMIAAVVSILLLGLVEMLGAYVGDQFFHPRDSSNHVVTLYIYLMLVTVVLASICANITNIYAGSVGWEVLVPRVIGKQEYLIIGLGAISAFTILQNPVVIARIVNIGDLSMSALGVVIVVSYVFNRFRRTSLGNLDRYINLFAWVSGIIVGMLTQILAGYPGELVVVWASLTSLMVAVLLLLIRISIPSSSRRA